MFSLKRKSILSCLQLDNSTLVLIKRKLLKLDTMVCYVLLKSLGLQTFRRSFLMLNLQSNNYTFMLLIYLQALFGPTVQNNKSFQISCFYQLIFRIFRQLSNSFLQIYLSFNDYHFMKKTPKSYLLAAGSGEMGLRGERSKKGEIHIFSF